MRAARSATAALLLLALTGCAGDGPAARPAATGDVPAPAAVPSAAPEPSSPPVEPTQPEEQRCDHPTQGFSIPFPAGWHVAAVDGIEPCRFFDPEPLALEPGTEATGVAIRTEVRDVPFAQAREDALAAGEATVEDTTAADRVAVRLEGRLTEDVLLPAGTRFTTWLVELDAGTLLLTTDDAGEDDYDVAVGVLDAMVSGLEIP